MLYISIKLLFAVFNFLSFFLFFIIYTHTKEMLIFMMPFSNNNNNTPNTHTNHPFLKRMCEKEKMLVTAFSPFPNIAFKHFNLLYSIQVLFVVYNTSIIGIELKFFFFGAESNGISITSRRCHLIGMICNVNIQMH